jgi:hypothetical protein
MTLLEHSTTGLAVKYGDVQLAAFDILKRGSCGATDVYFWIAVCVVERLLWIVRLLEIRPVNSWSKLL